MPHLHAADAERREVRAGDLARERATSLGREVLGAEEDLSAGEDVRCGGRGEEVRENGEAHRALGHRGALACDVRHRTAVAERPLALEVHLEADCHQGR